MLIEPVLIDLMHISIEPNDYISRYTVKLEFKSDTNCPCANEEFNRKDCSWLSIDQLREKMNDNDLWGPEPYLVAEKCFKQNDYHPNLMEISSKDIKKYLNITLQDQKHPLTMLLHHLKLDESDLYCIWIQYLFSTYPSIYMTKYSMQDFLANNRKLFDIMLINANINKLARAFKIGTDNQTDKYFDFDQFLFGLTFMDQACLEDNNWTNIQTSYIFRYYSDDGKCITISNLKDILQDMETFHQQPDKAEDLDNIKMIIKNSNEGHSITFPNGTTACPSYTFDQFFSLFKEKNLNKNSIWKLSISLKQYLNQAKVSDGIFFNRNLNQVIHKRNETMCQSCWSKKPTILFDYTPRVDYIGCVLKVYVRLFQLS